MARFDPARLRAARYDAVSVALHWTTAALVAALWLIGQTIGFFPRGDLRAAYLALHITLGVTLAVVLAARLAWRRWGGTEVPELSGKLLAEAARAGHIALYGLLLLAITLGVLTALGQGDSLFGLVTLPSFGLGGLAREFWSLHALAANVLLALAGLHALAALGHHFVLRDATLRRMLPARIARALPLREVGR